MRRVSIFIIVWFCITVLFGIFKEFYEKPPIERHGGRMDLRGGQILALRTPIDPPFERLIIYDDGRAFRISILNNNTAGPKTHITLSIPEQQAVQTFRTQWCQDQITFRAVAAEEQYYDLAVLCDHVQQTKVPIDLLPLILETILKRLPPLPASYQLSDDFYLLTRKRL